jgi:hypothetical protein
MLARRAFSHAALFLVLGGLLIGLAPPPVAAQSLFGDEFDRNEFVESDEGFIEETDPFGLPTQEDFTEGGQFIDEEAAPGRGDITISGRRTQLRVQSERELLPRNIAWGAGTGLMIGGWFALIENGTDRETQRSIGLGVVLGALLGMTVGLKTVIAPEAPRAALLHPASAESPAMLAYTAPRAVPLRLGFALRF